MAGIRIRERAQQDRPGESQGEFDHPILVVEDQGSIALYLAAMLKERWSCEVVLANSLRATRDVLDAAAPEIRVAICDLNLPDAQHGEVMGLLNERGVAPIVLTGAYDQALCEMLIRNGAVDFIRKDSINAYEYAVKLAGRLEKNAHVGVLIVDDAPDKLADLRNRCALLGFHVFTAASGKEALHQLIHHPQITLMLVDPIMPEMNGFELTARARTMFGMERLAIIGISEAADEYSSANFLKCGANDYLSHPFSYQEFLCRIHQNLDMLDIIRANQEAAQRDYMTRLYNRRYFFELAAPIHAQARKGNTPLAAAIIDVDSIGEINDRYGHEVGDAVIRHVANLLQQECGKHLVARIGGEEFAVLMEKTAPEEAHRLLEQLRLAVRDACVYCGTEKISCTISAGVSNQMGESMDDMLRGAGAALHLAKANGRDRVCSLDMV